MKIKLTPPKFITWLISVILGVVGLILFFVIPATPIISVLVTLAGLVLLAVGNAVKGV